MKKLSNYYKEERENFISILEKHIEETYYLISRAYLSKRDGFESLFLKDLERISKVSYVVLEDWDVKILDNARELELNLYDTYKSSQNKEHYVYAAYGVNSELLYVGKGTGRRYKHCNSGISSSYLLNKYYFNLKDGEEITVKILKNFENSEKALDYEKNLILELKPPYNLSL